MKPTMYSCQIVSASNANATGIDAIAIARPRSPAMRIGRRRRRSTQTPGRQAEQDERQELDRREQPELERGDLERGRGDDRQGQLRDRAAEDADGLGGPQLEEVGVAEEASGRLLHARRSLPADPGWRDPDATSLTPRGGLAGDPCGNAAPRPRRPRARRRRLHGRRRERLRRARGPAGRGRWAGREPGDGHAAAPRAPHLDTAEGEAVSLLLNRYDLNTSGPVVRLSDPGAGEVAADGEQVTLFGGRGADGALYVCAVDERHAGFLTARCAVGRSGVSRVCRIGACWSKACPTSPRGDASTSSSASRRALTSVPGVYLLDRTSDASHNRSVFTVAGEHDAVSAGLEELVGDGARRDRDGRAHGRAPPDRLGRRRPVRAARRHDDGRLRRARARASASGSPGAGTCPSTSTPAPRCAPTGSSSPTCGAASTRASRRRSGTTAASRTSGPRGCTRGRGDRRRRAAVPDRLEHQPRLATTSSSRSGSRAASASRAAGCRGSRRTASGSRSRTAATPSAPRSR